jgi:molecular chaperone GrpE (heat shock protein)
MARTIAPSDEFAAAMQQLSAEAAKSLPASASKHEGSVASEAAMAQLRLEMQTLTGRLERLEDALFKKIDSLTLAISRSQAGDPAERFRKIDDQLAAIRSTESVNQRLFDSLHDELLKYRDNFLHESLQKPFIHDLVMLFDDLSSLSEQLRTAADAENQRGHTAQWRDNLDNAVHSLVEILHRFEVKEIEPKEHVDRALHRVVSYEPANFAEEDGCIVMRVRRGFFWRGKLIRPEEVIAKRFE